MGKNTDSLIDSLASDLEEIKCAQHPLKTALPWFVFAVLYIAFAIAMLGLRGDFSSRITDADFVFELGLVMAMSMSATLCSLWLCFPDMRGNNWLLAVPISLFSVLMLLLVSRGVMNFDGMPQIYWCACINKGFVFGILPAATLLFLSAKGKTTRPQMLAFMNTAAIGGLGYLALRLTCGYEDMGHIMMYHVGPYIFMGLVIALAGIKFFKW